MPAELHRALARFPDAVLSGLDGAGRPVSVRCRPSADPARGVLRCARASGVDVVDGPASLLCHSHDEKLARLRSFLVRGSVATEGAEWVFTPGVLVEGLGMAGPLGDARAFVAARRRAGRWLAARRLPRPRVPWTRVRA